MGLKCFIRSFQIKKGFITKIHISRYVDPIFMYFMAKKSQNSVVLEYVQKPLFFVVSFDGVDL